MTPASKVWKTCIAALFALICFCGCTTPAKRTDEAEAGSKVKLPSKIHTVVIQQMMFTPASVTVNNGDTIMWINKDIVDHNVTEQIGKNWTSGNMRPGSSWKMAVAKSSTYFCTIHPVMKGSVSVK